MPSQPGGGFLNGVTIILIDFKDTHDNNTPGEIYWKFFNSIRRHQEGRIKWFNNRERSFGNFLPIEFHNDQYYISKHNLLQYLPPDGELRKNRECILKSVQCHGCALKHVPHELKNDREIVLRAVEEGGEAVLQFVGDELVKDREILEIAKKRSLVLNFSF